MAVERDSGPTAPADGVATRADAYVTAAAIGTALGTLWSARRFSHDDAFISFRYVARLWSGQGLTWTSGAPTEGFTHPLWILLLSMARPLPLSLLEAARAFGVLSLAALFFVWIRACLVPDLLLVLAAFPGIVLLAAYGVFRLAWFRDLVSNSARVKVFAIAPRLQLASAWEDLRRAARGGLNDRVIASRLIRALRTYWQEAPGHLKGDGAYVLARRPHVIIPGPAQGTMAGAGARHWFLRDLELAESKAFREQYDGLAFLVPIDRSLARALTLPADIEAIGAVPFIFYARRDSPVERILRGTGAGGR